jgi:hypothetical protein
MFNKMRKILNPKHQILNKFKYLKSKYKTISCFCHCSFGNLGLFRISDLELRIYIIHKVLSSYRGLSYV